MSKEGRVEDMLWLVVILVGIFKRHCTMQYFCDFQCSTKVLKNRAVEQSLILFVICFEGFQ